MEIRLRLAKPTSSIMQTFALLSLNFARPVTLSEFVPNLQKELPQVRMGLYNPANLKESVLRRGQRGAVAVPVPTKGSSQVMEQ